MKKQSIYKNLVIVGTFLLLPLSNIYAEKEVFPEFHYKSITEKQESYRANGGLTPDAGTEGKGDPLGSPIGDALPYLLSCSLVYGAFLWKKNREKVKLS